MDFSWRSWESSTNGYLLDAPEPRFVEDFRDFSYLPPGGLPVKPWEPCKFPMARIHFS
jgi:hypothetical protein